MPYGQDGQYPGQDGQYPTNELYPAGNASSYPPAGQYPTEQYPTGQPPQYPTYPTAQYPAPGYTPQMPQATGYGQPMMGGYPAKNGAATCALVIGIAAQIMFFLAMATAFAGLADVLVGTLALLTPGLGIASVILGIVGLSKAKPLMGAGRGKAITGMVLGILASVAIIGVLVLGLNASTTDSGTESDRVTQTDPDDATSTDRNPYGEGGSESDSTTGGTSAGGTSTGSTPRYASSDNLTDEQLDAMLSGGIIWEGHLDDGTIGCKFTFDSTSHTYSYWRGNADPIANTGDRISGTYEVYFDDDAYKYVNDLTGTGDKAKEQVARQSELRGEPVHYMILLTTPQTQNIGGTESPSDDKRPLAWEGTWMTQSKHIGIINTNSGNSYDMYDSTVPVDQRETAATRFRDTVISGLDEQDGSEG